MNPTRDRAIGSVLLGVLLSAVVVAYLCALLVFPAPRTGVLSRLLPSPLNEGRLRTLAATIRRIDGVTYRAAVAAGSGNRRAAAQYTLLAAQMAAAAETLRGEVPVRDPATPEIAATLSAVRSRLG
ncbi:MAG TPA: hypothetical protein VM490_16315, partial [Armatimonadaceae bacterium]|nr:hypothetical protein [Armatimonadaceae bacterium]